MVLSYDGSNSKNGFAAITPYAWAKFDHEGVVLRVSVGNDLGDGDFFVASLDLEPGKDRYDRANYRVASVTLGRESRSPYEARQVSVSRLATLLRERGTAVMDLLGQYLDSEKTRVTS